MEEQNPNKNQKQKNISPDSNLSNDGQAAKMFGFDEKNPPIKTKSLWHTTNNLDTNKKAESRRSMSGGRGTGHYGSGFYAFGDRNYANKYAKRFDKARDVYEIDASKYNLYRPENENEGKNLHNNLKILNETVGNRLPYIGKSSSDLENAYNQNMPDYNKYQTDEEYHKAYSDYLRDIIKTNFGEDSWHYDEINKELDAGRYGGAENMYKKMLSDMEDTNNGIGNAVDYLSKKFNISKEKARQIALNSIMDTTADDSASTQFMKSLGYEGIDVSGYPGLNNEEFGSVIYDLKPDTYKKYIEDDKNADDIFGVNSNNEKDLISEFNNSSVNKFTSALSLAKATNKLQHGWRVDAQTPDNISENHPNSKFFVGAGGSCAAVDSNGEIYGVCRNYADKKIRGRDMIAAAVKAGGNKLDSYEGNHYFYVSCGFEPVSWVSFDEQFAPEDWKKGVDFPENIIMYKYVGIDNVKMRNLEEFYNLVPESADYESAMKARDESMRGE